MKGDQVKPLKALEKESERLREAVSDLTLEKLILKEAAWEPKVRASEPSRPRPPSQLR